MRFSILGPVEVWAQERRVDLGGSRQLMLLAFLVLHANRAVSNDSLIDGVWGSAGAGAEKRLQMAITRVSGTPEGGRVLTVRGIVGDLVGGGEVWVNGGIEEQDGTGR